MSAPTLRVEDLSTQFFTKAGLVKAVDGVSFSVEPGEIMGLVGESGSGKSVTGYSVLGLVDEPGRVVGGRILFKGEDLAAKSPEQRRELRGSRIAAVFQDPLMTLNPVLKVETQMVEAIQAHGRVSRAEARRRCVAALGRVGIPAAEERLSAYPHQFSGGMRQRVCIAIALLNRPDLIIADEPTTALDVTIQAQILHEMRSLCSGSGTSLIWISHDLSVVAGLADQIAVMYAGRIVERGPVGELLERPAHPYTRGLIRSVPANSRRGGSLYQIPGMTPSLVGLGEGCAFRERCDRADGACLSTPPEFDVGGGRTHRCFHPYEGRHTND
ncbi:MAG TPA: ABC transporter ATP-binding protein [Spirochaetales bacterium]|nr:ABC transporter ATP-binding protein [Spirochaetales bacterium]HRY55631.1 ABC transporter ATP-binding protein [Spirochaetia bacterium]HRZ64499.1 ABC transporter ATP-binding protein [Spirochaetia bacterium]